MDLENFEYRREKVRVSEIFPKFDISDLREKFPKKDLANPHQVIFETCLDLWDSGYDYVLRQQKASYAYILDKYGFHEKGFEKFSGHCHQITPALGIVLLSLGFPKVGYLECFRVDPETLEKVPPEEEPNPQMREEFCAIGRIPYCCLGVEIDGEMYYTTGKHLKRVDGKPQALLTPVCYRNMVGVFAHQDDSSKSGVYLDIVQNDPVVWKKQTSRDPEPEFFKTFVRMDLALSD